MKKFLFIIIYMIIPALIVAPAFSGPNPKGKPFVAIQGQLVEVKGEIQSINEQIADLLTDVTSLSEAVGNANTRIDSLTQENLILQGKIEVMQQDYTGVVEQLSNLTLTSNDLQSQLDVLEANQATEEEINLLKTQMQENEVAIEEIVGENGRIALLNSEMEALSSKIQSNTGFIQALQDQVIPELERMTQIMENIIGGKCSNGQAIREILSDGTVVCESGPLLISPGADWQGELVQVENRWTPTPQDTSYIENGPDPSCGRYPSPKSCCWEETYTCNLFFTCSRTVCGTSSYHCGNDYPYKSCEHTHTIETYPYEQFSLSVSCPPGYMLTQWGYQAPSAEDTISGNQPNVTVDFSGNAISGYTVSGEHAQSLMPTYVTANATCLALP